MAKLPIEYWHELSNQFILISVFLGGFSITITANLLINQTNNKLYNIILGTATISSGSFLIAVFALTNIFLMTTESSPLEFDQSDLNKSRAIGFFGHIIGVFSLLTIMGLSGWTKNKRIGIFTTIVSVITLILFIVSIVR